MFWLATMMTLAQSQAATPQANPTHYAVLGDETSGARVRALLAQISRHSPAYAPTSGGADCSAWRNNDAQREECIRARIPRTGNTIILDTYTRTERPFRIVVRCIGPGRSEGLVLEPRAQLRDAQRLRYCMSAAGRGAPAPQLHSYRILSPSQLSGDAQSARSRAAAVLRVAIDHLQTPRGAHGTCRAEGRVVGVIRGAGLTPRGFVDFNLPCAIEPWRRRSRTIRMGDMQAGNLAEVYLNRLNMVIHLEPPTVERRGGASKLDL